MPKYAPELVASVLDQYINTDKRVERIAADHELDPRDVTRIRAQAGCPRRRDRVHDIPVPMQALQAVRAQLRAQKAEGADGKGRAKLVPANAVTSVPAASAQAGPDDDDGRAGSARAAPPTPDLPDQVRDRLSPPLPPGSSPGVVGGGESAPSALPSAIERIERLLRQELAAEEATREQLGSLARSPIEAERCARTLSIFTQTLQALARLRGGAAPDQGSNDDDDDMPRDIDEFRRDLARRIDAFVASRTDGGSGDGDAAPQALDAVR